MPMAGAGTTGTVPADPYDSGHVEPTDGPAGQAGGGGQPVRERRPRKGDGDLRTGVDLKEEFIR